MKGLNQRWVWNQYLKILDFSNHKYEISNFIACMQSWFWCDLRVQNQWMIWGDFKSINKWFTRPEVAFQGCENTKSWNFTQERIAGKPQWYCMSFSFSIDLKKIWCTIHISTQIGSIIPNLFFHAKCYLGHKFGFELSNTKVPVALVELWTDKWSTFSIVKRLGAALIPLPWMLLLYYARVSVLE